MTTKISLPQFFIFLNNETDCWHDDDLVQRCGGSIKGAYFFNANRHVFCCEMTPSYEMESLGSVAGNPTPYPEPVVQLSLLPDIPPLDYQCEHEREIDRIDMDLMNGDRGSDSVSYFHVSDIDLGNCIDVWKFNDHEWQELLAEAEGDEERAYEMAVDAVREHIQQNGYY